jgi:hypothetical protein
MRRIVMIALSALTLSSCIAQWPSNRPPTGQRFHDFPGGQYFPAPSHTLAASPTQRIQTVTVPPLGHWCSLNRKPIDGSTDGAEAA